MNRGRFCLLSSSRSLLSVTAVIRLASYIISGLEPQGERRRLDAKTDSLIVTRRVTWTWVHFSVPRVNLFCCVLWWPGQCLYSMGPQYVSVTHTLGLILKYTLCQYWNHWLALSNRANWEHRKMFMRCLCYNELRFFSSLQLKRVEIKSICRRQAMYV